jgi:hypothetical protein
MPFFGSAPGQPLEFSLRLRSDGRFGLRDRFGYRDPSTGDVYLVPRFLDQFSTDGASVPAAFTWLVARIDGAAPANVLHDALILRRRNRLEHIGPEVAREHADGVFLAALAELDVPIVRRHLMWAAVRLQSISLSWPGRLAIAGTVVIAAAWVGALVAAALVSIAVGLLAVVLVAGALVGVAVGGNRLRPLALGVVTLPLLVPVMTVVTVTDLLYRGIERVASRRRPHTATEPEPPTESPPARHAGRSIFVSYAREDRRRVEPLVEILAAATGANVWWDNEILPGDAWRSEILDALSAAHCVVVLWSMDAVRSEFILRVEATDAHKRGIMVQALLDDVQLPDEVAGVQAASLFDDPTGEELDKLVRAAGRMVSREAAA